MIKYLLKMLLMSLPFLLFAFLNAKANLKKKVRNRQFLMPIFAFVYCIIIAIYFARISDYLVSLLLKLPSLLQALAEKLPEGYGEKVFEWGSKLRQLLLSINLTFWIFFISNAVLLLAHVILKRIVITFLKLIFRKDNAVSRFLSEIFYDYDDEAGYWYIKEHYGRMRSFLKGMYISLTVLSVLFTLASGVLYRKGLLLVPYYPVFAVILVGELYFIVDGLTKQELENQLSAEAEQADTFRDYALVRKALRRLFPDKLNAEDTTTDNDVTSIVTNEELVTELEESESFPLQAYGKFIRKKIAEGMEPDRNYLLSGRQLLSGVSVLFNNPFYHDLMPYAFFPLNRALLNHGRGLIILGRHGAEENAKKWCIDGLTSVTNVPPLWSVETLTEKPSDPAVGIITLSAVNDIALLEANRDYFHDVEFVMILEPSRLITTAQLGMNTIVRFCRENRETPPVFCSVDKNCDGLLDALSHVLMTELQEVSATGHHTGVSSYMCWEADDEPMQHRMLPNISRFLGFGTELSFAALRQQIPHTSWFGGEAFPVTDMNWIARQYYYDLLNYASLPATQETMDEVFRVSPDMWSAPITDSGLFTVEDESFNMFEVRRTFATRTKEQGFINVLSTAYLLRDYMAENCGIFSADPKAIPYVTADYARTERNVALRLCLRLCSAYVSEQDIRREMMLLDAPEGEVRTALWNLLCKVCSDTEDTALDKEKRPILSCRGKSFSADIINKKPKFSLQTGKTETVYYISDASFSDTVLSDIRNAEYIAEDDNGDTQYLGSELMGQVFQKRLPGQFFTFCGRYYQMLRVSANGKVIVRRASDHISGRPTYRQERHYRISNVKDSTVMGESRSYGKYSVCTQYADVRVETPAYWDMARYNDFKTGVHVDINGVPERSYRRKPILRIDFNKDVPPNVLQTTALLFHEVLRSMFAENQDYLAVVTPAGCEIPMTYSIEGENGTELSANSIYIIEDSRMDIGLLVAVERNLKRIFEIIYDYLLWHEEAEEKSRNPEPDPEPVDYTVDNGDVTPPKKKNVFRRVLDAIKNFFRKLFGKKPKEDTPADGTPAEDAPVEDAPVEDAPVGDAPIEDAPAEDAPVEDVPVEDIPAEDTSDNVSFKPLLSRRFSTTTDAAAEESDAAEYPNPSDDEIVAEGSGTELTFEGAEIVPSDIGFERKPYHERHFLLYGGEEIPQWLDINGLSEFLRSLGCDSNYLTQARKNKNAAEFIERNFVPNRKGASYCDFCGCELTGTEYDRLADGRERCIRCGKTAVRSAGEFQKIYRNVIRNMDAYYGVRITKPVKISMVNAARLHKALGKTFVPTGNSDGRILGVAIRNKDGYSILMENGAPSLQSTMTMVHELTHIWQYLNWDEKEILRKYGKEQNLEIYEGMAKWVEIQYAYLINEAASAKREEIITKSRDDEYGKGFLKYLAHYPLSIGTSRAYVTPFDDKSKPL